MAVAINVIRCISSSCIYFCINFFQPFVDVCHILTDRMFSQDITERFLNVKFVFSWDFCGFLDYFLRVDHVIRLKKCRVMD